MGPVGPLGPFFLSKPMQWSAKPSTRLGVLQVVFVDLKVSQNLAHHAWRHFMAAVIGDERVQLAVGLPPDFVAPTSMASQLNTQPPQLSR